MEASPSPASLTPILGDLWRRVTLVALPRQIFFEEVFGLNQLRFLWHFESGDCFVALMSYFCNQVRAVG